MKWAEHGSDALWEPSAGSCELEPNCQNPHFCSEQSGLRVLHSQTYCLWTSSAWHAWWLWQRSQPGYSTERLAPDHFVEQVVICSNKCQDLNKVTQILGHELVHMFDDCSTKIDWSDLRHLACSEVRAANLAHCLGPLSGFMRDGAPLLDGHAACVKAKASRSVQLVGKVSKEQAVSVVEQVFNKCYLDLEPIGRRCWDDQEQLRAAEEENWRKGKYY